MERRRARGGSEGGKRKPTAPKWARPSFRSDAAEPGNRCALTARMRAPVPGSRCAPRKDDQPTSITTLPTWLPLARCAKAAFASSKPKTWSITGLMPAAATARTQSTSTWRSPTLTERIVATLEEVEEVHVRLVLAEETDQHDLAIGRDRLQRLADRGRATDLDDAVDATAAGQVLGRARPTPSCRDSRSPRQAPSLRRISPLAALDVVAMTRGAKCVGELHGEDRDAAGALRQHDVTCADGARTRQRGPGGRGGAGHGGAFAETQPVRQRDHGVLRDDFSLDQPAVLRTAIALRVKVARLRAAEPARGGTSRSPDRPACRPSRPRPTARTSAAPSLVGTWPASMGIG